MQLLSEKAFQKLLLEALDDAFSSLGDSARQSIYFHLKKKSKIDRTEIPCRLEDFESGLESIFGPGTQFLEILVMKKLHEKIGPKGKALKWSEEKEFKFVDYVKAAEESFSRQKRKRN
jgi:hypothetical protein